MGGEPGTSALISQASGFTIRALLIGAAVRQGDWISRCCMVMLSSTFEGRLGRKVLSGLLAMASIQSRHGKAHYKLQIAVQVQS